MRPYNYWYSVITFSVAFILNIVILVATFSSLTILLFVYTLKIYLNI